MTGEVTEQEFKRFVFFGFNDVTNTVFNAINAKGSEIKACASRLANQVVENMRPSARDLRDLLKNFMDLDDDNADEDLESDCDACDEEDCPNNKAKAKTNTNTKLN